MNVEAARAGVTTILPAGYDAEMAAPMICSPSISISIQQPNTPATPASGALKQFTKTLAEILAKFVDTMKSLAAEFSKRGRSTTAPSPFEIVESPKRAKRKRSKKAKGKMQGASGGFLWKPVSESDGKLVILLPSSLTGKVAGVRILDRDGKEELGKGRFSAVANGNREHFRFAKSGSSFPAGAIVEIQLMDKTVRRVVIDSTGARLED